MRSMGVYDQIKAAFQDIVAPEIRDLRGEVKRVDQKIDGLRAEVGSTRGELLAEVKRVDQKIDSMRGELVAEIRRVDARIDGVDRELRTAIDVRERLASLEARVDR